MDKIVFERPNKKHERDAIEYIKEFIEYKSPIEGVNGLHRYIDNYEAWLEKINSERIQKADQKNVPNETFFVYRESDHKLIGVTNLRLELNDRYKRFGGNIGNSIRPSERGKGYSKQLMYGALLFFDSIGVPSIMLDCDKKNSASRSCIMALGGELEKETYIEDLDTIKEDYKIDVKESISNYSPLYNDSIVRNEIISSGNLITDVFYNEIIPEASKGKIDAFVAMNITFGTRLHGLHLTRVNEDKFNEITIPDLNINNKELFDELLIEYVNKAISHYSQDESNFRYFVDASPQDIDRYKIKYIIGNLFANASYYDFENPIPFLRKRISMFTKSLEDEKYIFDLDTIGGTLSVEEMSAPIQAETPYKLVSSIEFDDYTLKLPDVYGGIDLDNDEYVLYSIMSKMLKDNVEEEKNYIKQIRKGYIAKLNGAPEHFFLASFLPLAFNKKVCVIPYLPQRWNAKRMSIINSNRLNDDEKLSKKILQSNIQGNITDGLIRYYSKIEDVSEGLGFSSLPFQSDDKLHITIDDDFNSRCTVFNEIMEMVKKDDNKKHR